MITRKKILFVTQLTIACLLGATYCQADTAKSTLTSVIELSKQAPTSRHLNIQEWHTKAGSKVLFVEAHELPMFDMNLTFAAGSSRDGNKPGVAFFTNGMLNEGINGMDVTAISSVFEGVGAEFGNGAYTDMAVVSLRSLTDMKKRQVALDLFTKVISEPTFPESSFKRIKNQIITGFEIQKKTPASILSKEFYSKLYGVHPYAHPSDGDTESIKAMKIADLKAFYQKAYNANNVVISMVGDLSKEEAEAIAEKISTALPKGQAFPQVIMPQIAKPGTYHIDFPSNQTHIVLGQLGVTRNDPDFAALYLGNQILGGGSLSSRLMIEVRERRGLTYGIYSAFSTMQAPGPFSIRVQTRAEMTEGTLALIKQIVADYLVKGPTQKEVDEAKQEIIGSFPLANASNSSIVGQLGAIGFYNLPRNYLEEFVKKIQEVTPEQIKEAMSKHINESNFIVVTVGPTVKQQPLPEPTVVKKGLLGVPEH